LSGTVPRRWLVGAPAALIGWLFVVLLAVVGVRPVWLVLLAAVVATLALTTLYERRWGFRPFEVFSYTFACIVLEWPVLFLVTLVIAYWVSPPAET
jgi:hypothetical protein